jgi:outer membrane protein insertion porin family
LIAHSALSFFLMAPVISSAQDTAPENKLIVGIQVEPKAVIPLEAIHRLTGLEPGMPYSSKAVRDSIESLYRTGLFNDVQVEAESTDDGVIIRYRLLEKTFLAGLAIRGNWAFSDRTLQEALEIRMGEEFTEGRLKSAITRLISFYQKHGYFQIQVTLDIRREEGTNQVDILIRVKEGVRARIHETRFTEDKIFADLRLFLLIRSLPGEYYDGHQLEKDLRALENWYRSKGYLQVIVGPPEVSYRSDTNEVTLTLPIEAETRIEVRFPGRLAFEDDVLESQLLFKEERSYNEDVFNASADRLEEFYHARGYPFAKVQWTREEKPEERTILATFKITEGPQICLRSLSFEGNRFFSARKLRDPLSTKPGGFFRCRILNPAILKQDLERVEGLYREQGFLNVRVTALPTYSEGAEQAERATASVLIVIEEGIQTLVQDVVIAGNQAFGTPELMRKVRLTVGMPYNEYRVQQDSEELLHHYRQNGFIYARIESRTQFSDDRALAILTYTIKEDQMARIGRIFIKGNTFTRDRVIQRELKIESGDPYNEEDIQLSRHRILKLGYLSDVRFEPVTPISLEQKEYIKDMVLSVNERPPKAIEFGIGYADVERLRGFAELSNRNLAGTGRFLSLRGEASSIERRSILTFVEPWVFTLPMDARVKTQYETQVRPSYDLTALSGSVGVEKNLTEILKASLTYQIEFANFTSVPEEILQEEDQGRVNIATLNPSLILDTRDNPFNPTSGTLNGLVFRLGAKSLGSEVQIRKATVNSNWYIPLTRWLVLALSARGGIVEKFGESKEVPLSERFFLGGRSTVRGYPFEELGIVGETIVPKGDLTGVEFKGGNAEVIGNVELRLFLPGGLGLVLFNDRGNAWLSHKDVHLNELKSTVGAGLRYNTPVGPLRLDYGYKLDREKNLCPTCPEPVEEDRYELHFTLGHAF